MKTLRAQNIGGTGHKVAHFIAENFDTVCSATRLSLGTARLYHTVLGTSVMKGLTGAWGAGTGIMEKQVAKTKAVLQSLDQAGVPWVLGGDLNLLPPDDNRQRARILAAGTGNYDENPQIAPLYERYRGIPPIEPLLSDNPAPWYTHFPNNPLATGPDRTIDYLFFSDQWQLTDAYVMQGNALQVSDHLPVVGVYRLPAKTSPAHPAQQDIGVTFQQ